MFARAVIALLLLVATPAMAADPSGLWAVRAGDKALFQFELHHSAKGWAGVWVRPEHFVTDGDSFSTVTGPVIRRTSISARVVDDSVELSFDDPRPGATPDIFRIHAIDARHAEALYVGMEMEPFALVREAEGTLIGPWDPQRSYVRQIDRPTNAEMTAIYDADQKARQNRQKIDWAVVRPADEQRRIRTQALIDGGSLKSGDDFLHAAFVFQHGDKSEDYLKAHLLAMIAVARGKPAAIWIASATLDRYLQNIGQPQVLGTQYRTVDGKTTQDPYARTLLSDSLRQALRVPTLAEQEEQRRDYEREAATARP